MASRRLAALTSVAGRSGIARVGAPLLVCAVIVGAAALPPLLGSSDFYLRGDSATQFLPTWYHLGELLRSGVWPPWLDPAAWVGGNYAAEALYGIYNPLDTLVWLVVSALPDLALSAFLVKAVFLALLGLGVYLLAREYGAARWAATAVAVALPFSGFTLYWDTASWTSGLIGFAYVPHVWWSLRRSLRARLNPLWPFAVGALTVTHGNPYGVLGIVVVGLALSVELVLRRDWAVLLRRLLPVGACIAAFVPLVFWPLLATLPVTVRAAENVVANTGFMRPELGDVVLLSFPTHLPDIATFHGPMQVPATYLAWFVLPLLPWLRWTALARRWPELSGLAAYCTVYLLLTVAPSRVESFRWPLRLVEYLHLGLLIGLAVALSAGWHHDRRRTRTAASAVIVALSAYLAWAQTPHRTALHLAGFGTAAVLTAGLVMALRRRPDRPAWRLGGVLVAGTLLVLVVQSVAFPQNSSAARWDFPHSVQVLRERFGDRYPGTTLAFASIETIRDELDRGDSHPWRDLLMGSAFQVAGVETVDAYTGLGYASLTKRLCLHRGGCPAGYRNLGDRLRPGGQTVAGALKLDTIVLQRRIAQQVPVLDGWHVQQQTPGAVVLAPDRPPPWPDSRLSWASAGLEVLAADTAAPTVETVQVRAQSPGPHLLRFARLAWPGYTATLDGAPVRVSTGPIGLVEVQLPGGAGSGTLVLRFRPPGLTAGLGLAGLGLTGAVLLALTDRRHRRSRRGEER